MRLSLALADPDDAETAMSLPPPINFQRWIDEHRHLLKPPVGNKCVYDGDFIVMVVGGPNVRTDYHYDEGPEFFHQIEGEMVLKLMLPEGPQDVPIRAGEIFYLPPRIPHSPQRMAGSVGLVVERRRLAHERDGLMWYCPACHALLYEEMFALDDIEQDFPPVFDRFYSSMERRTCGRCGTVHPAPERYPQAPGRPAA
jgi:3-hydroxyanthranilate 3,4-dioxygenase